jgi:hypothetical protein
MTYLHNISFKVVPLVSGTLLPTFIKRLKHSWKLFFDTSVSAFVVSAATSLALVNRHFGTVFRDANSDYVVQKINNMISHSDLVSSNNCSCFFVFRS